MAEKITDEDKRVAAELTKAMYEKRPELFEGFRINKEETAANLAAVYLDILNKIKHG